MTLHPYDNQTRVLTHDDVDQSKAREVIARLLGGVQVPALPVALKYHLSFYSGGMGIIDHLTVSLGASREFLDRVVKTGQFVHWERARLDDDVRWLIDVEEFASPEAALTDFCARHQLTTAQEIWFAKYSDVNSWTLLAWTGDGLELRSFDQG